jgi:hypothetical protein
MDPSEGFELEIVIADFGVEMNLRLEVKNFVADVGNRDWRGRVQSFCSVVALSYLLGYHLSLGKRLKI